MTDMETTKRSNWMTPKNEVNQRKTVFGILAKTRFFFIVPRNANRLSRSNSAEFGDPEARHVHKTIYFVHMF